MSVEFKSLTLNIRNAHFAAPGWRDRKWSLVNWIKKHSPEVVYLQECTLQQIADLRIMFGPDWKCISSQNCIVLWKKYFWDDSAATVQRTLPGPQIRGFAGIWLTDPNSKLGFWACSTTLSSARPDAPFWRIAQARAILSWFHPEELEFVQIGGDFNSITTPPHAGVRMFFHQHGLEHLRGKLRAAELEGEEMNTKRRWWSKLRIGAWQDDILTGATLQPVSGQVASPGRLTEHSALIAVTRLGA